MANLQYTVKNDERWDNLANKFYGEPGMIEIIVQANPNVPVTPIIAAGTVMAIPILEELQAVINIENLPPWMH